MAQVADRPTALGAAHSTGVLAWLTAYVVLLFAIPSQLVIGPLGATGAPSTVFGLASALVWFLAQLWRSTRSPAPWRPVRVALAVFLAAIGLSYVVGMTRPIDSDEVSTADFGMLALVSWSGVLLIAHDGLAGIRDVAVIVRRFVMAGGVMAAVGIAQFLSGQILVDRLSVPGLHATGALEISYRNGLLRMSGTATSPIEFGALLSILLPLAIHNALHPVGRGAFWRWFPVGTISVALALSLSRSAYIGLLVALAVLLIGWPRRLRWRMVGLMLALSAAMTVAVPRLFSSIRSMFFTAKDDPSIASRTDSYAVASQFFHEAPWLGRGFGTFLPKYRIFDNNYLGLLVGAGIIGTLAFVGLVGAAIVLLLRHRARWPDERSRDLALSLVAGILAGAVSLAFFDAFGFPMTTGTLFLTLGLAGALVRVRSDDPVKAAAELSILEADRLPAGGPATPDGGQAPRARTKDASATSSAVST